MKQLTELVLCHSVAKPSPFEGGSLDAIQGQKRRTSLVQGNS